MFPTQVLLGLTAHGGLGELRNREILYTLKEVQVLTEEYKQAHNHIRPHSSLGYKPPAPEAALPPETAQVLAGLT